MTNIFKNEIIWRIIATLLMSIIIGIGGWGLAEVTKIPKEYISKDDFNIDKKEIHQQLCELKEDINNKMNSLKIDIERNQSKLESKIDGVMKALLQHSFEYTERNGSEKNKQ